MNITDIWNLVFFNPMVNGLILLSRLFFGNFGLTIAAFTIIVRLIMLPLTMKQLHASKAMSTLQPKIQELQKRHKGDKEKLSKETMSLYKEHGVNPLGCAVPTLIQFPIWIGLYQAIMYALSDRPEGWLNLSQHLYADWKIVAQTLPLDNTFLWLNLANPDQYYILPVLVAASMFLQQKMMTMPSTDPQQAQMNQMMQWMMPVMFGYFTLQFSSGLAIYWVISNIISIVLQYYVTGWGSLKPTIVAARGLLLRATSAPASQPRPEAPALPKADTTVRTPDSPPPARRRGGRRKR